MVNLTALNNIPPLELDTSILDNLSTHFVTTASSVANETSTGWYSLLVQIPIFIFLLIILYRIDGDLKIDIARTILLSSGFTFILSILMLILNFSNTIQPMLWWLIIFGLSIISVKYLKSNNLA